MAEAKATTKKKKKAKRSVTNGQVHIQATFNNTIITITDTRGQAIAWSSAGACGFRGSRKSSAYAAQIASEKAIADAQTMGLLQADVFVKGIGQGRDAAVRAFQNTDVKVKSIKDVTAVPHNGVRPKKPRRI